MLIKMGSIIAFRTYTFYGLGADPFNRDTLQKRRALKRRDDGKPILLVIGDVSDVARFSSRQTKYFEALSARHWPGALTLVVSAKEDLPAELTAGTGTIGLRLPADAAVSTLASMCGGALTATSANLAGEPPARTAEEVARSFPSGLALIIDSGATKTEEASTVLDVSQDEPRLIREGAVSWRKLQKTIKSCQ